MVCKLVMVFCFSSAYASGLAAIMKGTCGWCTCDLDREIPFILRTQPIPTYVRPLPSHPPNTSPSRSPACLPPYLLLPFNTFPNALSASMASAPPPSLLRSLSLASSTSAASARDFSASRSAVSRVVART